MISERDIKSKRKKPKNKAVTNCQSEKTYLLRCFLIFLSLCLTINPRTSSIETSNLRTLWSAVIIKSDLSILASLSSQLSRLKSKPVLHITWAQVLSKMGTENHVICGQLVLLFTTWFKEITHSQAIVFHKYSPRSKEEYTGHLRIALTFARISLRNFSKSTLRKDILLNKLFLISGL